jgi:hypothetical protein
MRFGGGTHLMPPEVAARLAYGLVELDRETGMYHRAQLAPVDERMIIEQAQAREMAEAAAAGRDQPGPWSAPLRRRR